MVAARMQMMEQLDPLDMAIRLANQQLALERIMRAVQVVRGNGITKPSRRQLLEALREIEQAAEGVL